MANTTRSRRSRRRFDDDFKAQAAPLVLDEGKTVGAVARDLDFDGVGVARVGEARAQADRADWLTTAERELWR
jgi:transposase-like protein